MDKQSIAFKTADFNLGKEAFMPDTVQKQSAQLSADASYNVLVAQVHAPVFFNKLASVYGIVPQTQEEARDLLLLAADTRNAHEQQQVKQASARGTFYAEARRDLSTVLGTAGLQQPVEDRTHIKQAAAAAAQNPLIAEAALVFSQHLSQALQG